MARGLRQDYNWKLVATGWRMKTGLGLKKDDGLRLEDEDVTGYEGLGLEAEDWTRSEV